MHRRVLMLLALGGLLAGCGGGGSTSPPVDAPSTPAITASRPATTPAPVPTTEREPAPASSPEPRAPQTASVAIVDFDYAPDTIEITAGDSVVWTNQDSTSHTVSMRDGSIDSGVVMSGASFTTAFSTAGTFAYYCKFHPGSMIATVVVTPA